MLRQNLRPLIDRHEVTDYLPHREPMVMVDRLLGIIDGKTIGEFTIRPQNPFVTLSEEMLLGGVVEHMAQVSGLGQACESVQAHGIRDASDTEEGKFGFIVNVRDLSFSRLPRTGETLRTEVFTTTYHGNHSTANFTCFVGKEQIASCNMGLMAPE